jgi:hypothetical protein
MSRRSTSRSRRHFARHCALALVVGLSACAAAHGGEAGPAAPAIIALDVEPSEITLSGNNRQQQLLLTAHRADGRLLDVTRLAELSIESPGVARAVDGRLAAVADGETDLTVSHAGLERRIPVRVQGCDSYPPVHFANDVLPLFSKLGCNSGGCHGKASGQNGFKLSVFGFDPAADYDAIVKQARGRRLFPASPRHSLLLAKATARLPHGGGQRMAEGSGDYQLLLAWIAQAAPIGDDNAPSVVAIRVSPIQRVLAPSAQQQILATAVYSDGSLRDVTAAATYTTNAPLVSDVQPGGLAETGQVPGEAAITVNYMGHVAVAAFQVPRAEAPAIYPDLPVHNPIDELVWSKLRNMGILPSELADDATFLRRLYLDTIGTLPEPQEVRAFLSDTAPDKRGRWIEAVLARDEYADYWALKWADVLLVDRKQLGERGAFELHRWLRRQFAANRPYDEWVKELITAGGNSAREGPVNFFRAVRTPEELARNVSQAFLGVRIECAQCHHHPFEKWSQTDFYGLAGFFSGIERKAIREGRELVYHAGYRETRLPLTGAIVATRPLDGQVPPDLETVDPRLRLAEWMTAPENPWFSRLAANRLWKHFLGRGLVEPEDDLRTTNPATNEPLLDHLAGQLAADGYDLKSLMRLILNSRVYQLSSAPNDSNRDDDQNFSHYYVKRMPAEVLLDALSQATGTSEVLAGYPPGTRAIALWDNRLPSYFLEIFGRPERNSPCECGRSSEPTIAQALHLMNAPEVEHKISSASGRVARLLDEQTDEARIVEELCLAALGRGPTERELDVARELFSQAPRQEAAEDFLWTLLNSYDFLFVH